MLTIAAAACRLASRLLDRLLDCSHMQYVLTTKGHTFDPTCVGRCLKLTGSAHRSSLPGDRGDRATSAPGRGFPLRTAAEVPDRVQGVGRCSAAEDHQRGQRRACPTVPCVTTDLNEASCSSRL